MSELLELAERCEAATGPDRELDLRIEAATNPEYAGLDEEHANFLTKYGGQPRYTASLDAAMTLVPEVHGVCIEQERPSRTCEASVSPPGTEPWGPGSFSAEAHSLALALCAAALRARAATPSSNTQEIEP